MRFFEKNTSYQVQVQHTNINAFDVIIEVTGISAWEKGFVIRVTSNKNVGAGAGCEYMHKKGNSGTSPRCYSWCFTPGCKIVKEALVLSDFVKLKTLQH